MLEMVVPEQVKKKILAKIIRKKYCKVILGEMASLHCIYDMEGEELYSVKWYKVRRRSSDDVYIEMSFFAEWP